MISRVGERASQFFAPTLYGLSFTGIDEIERHALEGVPGEIERGERLFDGVLAAERFEATVVERLHAERQTIDTGRGVTCEVPGLRAGRIRFERDLGIVGNRPMRGDRVEDRCDRAGAHERGRSAAEKDARHGAARCTLREMPKLGQIGVEETILVDAAVAYMGIEVAIGAFGLAERPMDVDPEGLH